MTLTNEPGLTYDHALYRGTPGSWWRGLSAILLFVIAFLLLSTVLGGIGFAIEIARGELTLEQLADGIVPFTPVIMLSNNLALAASLPVAILLQRLFFGARPGTLSSVVGQFRWAWFRRLAIVIVPVWVVYVAVSYLLAPAGEWRLDATAITLLAIVILTTPLQAAGEEYGARGLVQRSVGSWFRAPMIAFVVGTAISGALFASAHFAGDPWLVAYYFVFGVSGSLAARGTGGLEAPVLIHAVNNVLLFVPAVLLGQLDQGIDRSAGTGGPFMLIPMALCLAAAGFSTWWGRRHGVETRVAAAAPEAVPAPV